MRRTLWPVVSLALLAGCGGGGSAPSTPTTPPTTLAARAVVTLRIDPNPITVVPSGDSDLPFQANWTLVLTETAGLSGNVNYVNTSFLSLCGSFSNVLNFSANDIIRLAGTNHFEPRGSLRIPMGIIYRGCFGTKNIEVRLEVNLTDDRGNTQTLTTSATASHAGTWP